MHKIKILYVEDEPSLARIVKESLEERGFEVFMVDEGSAAINSYKLHEPDICILDVMLPGKDGFSIAKDIRVQQPGIPIIFVTAKIRTADLIKGFESGGNDYIRKPFSMEELIVRVNNLLHLTSQKSKNTINDIAIGNYRFLPNRYELWHGDELVKLSARESDLLNLLWVHRNSTTLRKEILMKLWGDDSIFNSRNLDVYITKLRKYLGKDKNVMISTMKGTGYLFTCDPSS